MQMKIFKRNQIIISVIALMLITVGYMNYSANISNSLETNASVDGRQVSGIGDAKLVSNQNLTDNQNIKNKENSTSEENRTTNNNSSNDIAGNNKTNSIDADGVNNEYNVTSSTSTENLNNENTKSKTEQSTTSINNDIQTNSNIEAQETNSDSVSYTASNYFASSRIERDKMYSEMIETYEQLLGNSTISSEQKTESGKQIATINNKKNSIMIAENLIKNLGFDDVVIFANDNSVSVIVKAKTLQEADVAQIQNVVCRELSVKPDVIHISVR